MSNAHSKKRTRNTDHWIYQCGSKGQIQLCGAQGLYNLKTLFETERCNLSSGS